MSKLTVVMTPAVAVEFVWEPPREKLESAGGIVLALLNFLGDNGIPRVPGIGGTTGPGIFHGAFYPEDAPRVAEWLRARGVDVDEAGWERPDMSRFSTAALADGGEGA